MNALQILEKLNAMWFIIDTEDEGKKDCVSRRNVIGLAHHYLSDPNTKESDLWYYLCENSGECELDNLEYGEDVLEAYAKMDTKSNFSKQLCANDFVNALVEPKQSDNQEAYGELCRRLAIALDRDTEDVNPDFWDRAFEDGLTPIKALVDSDK